MNSPSRCFVGVLVVVCLFACLSSPLALAQSTNRQIGTQFEVTADPLVPRPHEQPCVVPLFADFQFAFFSTSVQTFPFTPPTECKGPWEKVVLEINYSENGGDQFDRTASIYLANTDIYFGTTPEPLATLTNTWHVERDVTDYAALMSIPQQGTMVLQNCTTDCPAPYNTELNGVFTVNADLEFYPAQRREETPRVADVVLPLEQPNGSGGVSLPALLSAPTDQLSTTFTLPTNIEEAYLDVVSQSQSANEQWYACLPNDQGVLIPLLFGCGNTDFRETEVTIDGNLAGIAPVSPWVFTGFLPDQWQPMPAAQTLDFVPYRVNLTPFAGQLSDGKQHTVAMSVFDDFNYFSVTGSLLLYLDHGSKHVSGALTKNTLTSPSPVVKENLTGTTTVTGTIGVTSNRNFITSGYVNTSHGKVSTTVAGEQRFGSLTTLDVNTVTQSPLDQNTVLQSNAVSRTTTVFSRDGIVTTHDDFNFPITVDLVFPVPTAVFGFTVDTTQKYHADKQIFIGPFLTYFNSTQNNVSSSDVSPDTSSQEYTYFDSTGTFYDCQIASKANTLTRVSRGCNSNSH
jgi:Peptide N-acetyl-beta-D-glucosaminyl asparaginase amidase A